MKILVEEEYGYRYWLWEVKTKTEDALQEYFKKVVKMGETDDANEWWYCIGVPSDHFIGEWKQLEWEEYKVLFDSTDYNGVAHIHQNDDSWININEN
tara:strand:- start:201 stop:491 length:291 start_codon:yes stop_codon:yes gene_type:complete